MGQCRRLFSVTLMIAVFTLTAATARGDETDFLKKFRKAYNVNIGIKKVIEEHRDLVPGEIEELLEDSHSEKLTPEQKAEKQYIAETMARVYKDVTGDISYLIEVKREIFNSRLHAPVHGKAIKGINIISMPRATGDEKNIFTPDNIVINAGEWVRWENNAGEAHIFSSMPLIGKQVLFTPSIKPDETWIQRFNEPGEYFYFCFIHSSMVGKITVLPIDKDIVIEKKGAVGSEHEQFEEHTGGEEHEQNGE
ncbi:MAG: plastocyanin/azurin family copper-binding protein [Thermodesulfobacteriota bacterium]